MANATALPTLLVSHYSGEETVWDRTMSGAEWNLVGVPEKRKRETSCSVLRRSGDLILHRMVERERATPPDAEAQREPGLRSVMSPGCWKDRNFMGNTFISFNSVSNESTYGLQLNNNCTKMTLDPRHCSKYPELTILTPSSRRKVTTKA